MPSTEPRGPRQIWRAFQWSMKGLRAAWQHEASFRLARPRRHHRGSGLIVRA